MSDEAICGRRYTLPSGVRIEIYAMSGLPGSASSIKYEIVPTSEVDQAAWNALGANLVRQSK